MRLNTIKSTDGSRRAAKRVGRGMGSGTGKTCGRGHKGQKSRSGGYRKTGFEGGQMPIQRRLPKSGFRSRKSLLTAQIRLSELNVIEADVVDLAALKAAKLINANICYVKIFHSGEIKKAVTVKGLRVSKGARAAIAAAGGTVEQAD